MFLRTLCAPLRQFVRRSDRQNLIEYTILGAFVALLMTTGSNPVATTLGEWNSRIAKVRQQATTHP